MNVYGIILAGGRGSRHRVLCDRTLNASACHKAMLPVGNKVLIDFSIALLKNIGTEVIHIGAGSEPLSDTVESHTSADPQIHVHSEPAYWDCMGGTRYILDKFLTTNSNDVICVANNDIPNNIDLGSMLEAHLKNEAAVTVAVFPLRWDSPEWERRTFGLAHLEGFPRPNSFGDQVDFERAFSSAVHERQGETLEVTRFLDSGKRKRKIGNLVNSTIFLANAGFLREALTFVTPIEDESRFSDFSLHLFPLMGGRSDEFGSHKIDRAFINRIRAGQYPFFAHILSPSTYWRDVGTPLALLECNMDALDGEIAATPAIPGDGNVLHSVVLDNIIVEGIVRDSLCFAGRSNSGTGSNGGRIVVAGIELKNSIYIGGNLVPGEVPSVLSEKIIYPTLDGEIAIEPL